MPSNLRISLWSLFLLLTVVSSRAQTFCNGPGCFHQPALSDIPNGTYYQTIFTGGLYGNWSNIPTIAQAARIQHAASLIQPLGTNGSACTVGTNSSPCKILLLTLGMSIGKFEWSGALEGESGDFISPQNSDIYSVLWWLQEGKNQGQQPPPPAANLNSYFYALVGNMNGHFAASWINDNSNGTYQGGTYPGNYSQISLNVLSPQWSASMWHSKGAQQYIIDPNGYVEEATNNGGPPEGNGQSGANPPAMWSTTFHGTTTDNNVTWQNDGLQNRTTPPTLQVYSFSPSQVQILHISNFTGLNYVASGSVMTQANSPTVTYINGSGNSFSPRTEADGGWDNFPLVLTYNGSRVTCGGKQCIIASVTSGTNGTMLTTTVPLDVSAPNASYQLGVGVATAASPICDGTWWTPACPNWQFLKWLEGQDIREGQSQYVNNRLTFLGGVDYCGYYRLGPHYCDEPQNWETWLATQALVMDQDGEMNTQVGLQSCTASSGIETCTATTSLPSQYLVNAHIHVSGITNGASLNTPCSPTDCSGPSITSVAGNMVTFLNGSASGTSTGGHISVVADPIAGSLESSDGTAAAIVIAEYTWEPGSWGNRNDGFGSVPPEAYFSDGVHPSSNEHPAGCGTPPTNGCDQAQTCSAGVQGDNHLWTYITNPAWCGQGYLSNQTFKFLTSNGYSYSSQSWLWPIICAPSHPDAGCL
jgi:hypothetical protein